MSRKKKALSIEAPSVNMKFINELQNDAIYVNPSVHSLKDLTGGMEVASLFQKAIVVDNKIVFCASDSYELLPNENFFMEVERKLMEAGINYVTRSINRENKHFAVDYILSDENYAIDVKNGNGTDKLTPMLRFTNSYAGGTTTGSFGFFREVCSNGLNIAKSVIGFKVQHHKSIHSVVLPEIGSIVNKFMDNEYYSLHKKFEVLAETPIKDLSDFVRFTCTKLDLFKFEQSEKNPTDPSKNAQFIMDVINKEANILNMEPNMWLGYNAFNEYIHASKKSFAKQKIMDTALFSAVMEMN